MRLWFPFLAVGCIERDIERCLVTFSGLGQGKRQLVSTAPVDAIVAIAAVALSSVT